MIGSLGKQDPPEPENELQSLRENLAAALVREANLHAEVKRLTHDLCDEASRAGRQVKDANARAELMQPVVDAAEALVAPGGLTTERVVHLAESVASYRRR